MKRWRQQKFHHLSATNIHINKIIAKHSILILLTFDEVFDVLNSAKGVLIGTEGVLTDTKDVLTGTKSVLTDTKDILIDTKNATHWQ